MTCWASRRLSKKFVKFLLGALLVATTVSWTWILRRHTEDVVSVPLLTSAVVFPKPCPKPRTCLIAVLVSLDNTATLGQAALETWVRPAQKVCNVRFMVSQIEIQQRGWPNGTTNGFRSLVMEIPVKETYPPQEFVFGMWGALAEMASRGASYEWFFKIDGDTFVNTNNLERLVQSLGSLGTTHVYRGLPGRGREQDKAKLGLRGRAFCMGPAYVLGRAMLLKLGPQLKTCLALTVTLHSDTEIGRCVLASSSDDSECARFPTRGLVHMYYGFDEERKTCVDGSALSASGQTASMRIKVPYATLTMNTFIHPVKQPGNFALLHQASTGYMAPMFSPAGTCHASPQATKQYNQHLSVGGGKDCSYNPIYYKDLYNKSIDECPYPVADMAPSLDFPAFVISLKKARFEQTRKVLEKGGFRDVRWWPGVNGRAKDLRSERLTTYMPRLLSPGELGLKEAVATLLEGAEVMDLERIAVFEDDVKLDCEFRTRLRELWADERCSGHIFTRKKGGVLLLGNTMWSNGFKRVEKMHEGAQCYTHVLGSLGGFAWIAHRSVFLAMARHIRSSSDPMDWVWNNLAEDGFVVRVAYPVLVAPDIEHVSAVNSNRKKQGTKGGLTVQERHKLHHWDLREYCN